ncbi:MAG: helix-turn-helix transcriptional regulator [Bacteroidia bacterium]|nr:helix-turn-helix domain-containing protein [Bacteroidia bacterium]MDW8333402.1 helix-turn-helix transcriptional regulator [Bacteroidia bacterium]
MNREREKKVAREKNEHFLRTVASRLRVWREKTGATQEEVYIATGVHVGRIETGKSNLTVSTLHVLCMFYGVSLSEFFRDFPDYSAKGRQGKKEKSA